jgi:NAD(P)H-hydrate epimerase
MFELLTNDQMRRADALTIEAGTEGFALMKAAGLKVAESAKVFFKDGGKKPILILCGPGNNGGDGFVAAEELRQSGWSARVVLLGSIDRLRGDAALAAQHYSGKVEPFDPGILAQSSGIVDALFGSGLSRPIEGAAAEMIEAVNSSAVPVLAIDMPSGIDGDSGQICGQAVRADCTVTFYRYKPGHFLYPGKSHCGSLVLQQIGIQDDLVDRLKATTSLNRTALWSGHFPWPTAQGHKYDRGHALVFGGKRHRTGAARLAANAALRIGAGLVSIACSPSAADIYAAHLTAVMLQVVEGNDVDTLLDDRRYTSLLAGPAGGVGEEMRQLVLRLLATDKPVVLDADALTSFAGLTDHLFDSIKKRNAVTVMTPHEGEFGRLFPAVPSSDDRLHRARQGAMESGALLVLKGPDTVIASRDGRAAINENGSPWLATAGSGDVLAGLIAGLVAQSMPPFEAVCAAVYLHCEAANRFGPGLTAENLSDQLPCVLRALYSTKHVG